MATSIGGVSLTAATPANINTAGGSGGTFNVNMLNTAATAAVVQLGVSSTSATFEAALKLVEALTIQPDESATYDGITCDGTDVYIVGQSDTTGVVMVAMGYDV
tara:strand:+ start:2069 stop:2380 length:312 start_codon:yes stop_codon:yes gene_type:complete